MTAEVAKPLGTVVAVGTVAAAAGSVWWLWSKRPQPEWLQQGWFHVSLQYNKLRWSGKQGAFNVVYTDPKTGHRIVLSRIPDDDTATWLAEDFKNGFAGIFSCVQEKELVWAGTTTDDLVRRGLIASPDQHHKVPMTDFCAEMDKKAVGRSVPLATAALEKGDILVHCKAGRARSALFVAMCLVHLGVCSTLREAVAQLVSPRVQVSVESDKQEAGNAILAEMKQTETNTLPGGL